MSERDELESHFSRLGYDFSGDFDTDGDWCYYDDLVQGMWIGWGESADLAAERERQLEDQVDYLRNANQELVEALKEFRYACTDKAEKMADAIIAVYDERNTNEQPPNGD